MSKDPGICAVGWCNDEVVRDARFCRPHLDDWFCLRLEAQPDGTFVLSSRPQARAADTRPEWLRRGVGKDLTDWAA